VPQPSWLKSCVPQLNFEVRLLRNLQLDLTFNGPRVVAAFRVSMSSLALFSHSFLKLYPAFERQESLAAVIPRPKAEVRSIDVRIYNIVD